MSARGGTLTVRCGEPGCRDSRLYGYGSQRELRDLRVDQARRPYKCSRHAHPEKNLRPDNTATSLTYVAGKVASVFRGVEEFAPGLYWVAEGELRSGFTFGPGFNAHANDFPEGTRLTVTAAIEMPAGVTS